MRLLVGYIDNHLPDKALNMLKEMTEESDYSALTIFFRACAALNDPRAVELGNKVLKQISTTKAEDLPMITSAINMLMTFGQIQQAEDLFRSLTNKDTKSQATMIKGSLVLFALSIERSMMAEISFVGYVNNNLPDKALDLFEQISPEPDDALLSSAFSACAASCDQRAIRLGNKLLRQIQENEAKDIIVINSAINMLMKFGRSETG